MSDHRYIKTSIVLNKLERGSGYWKLNVSHLEKQDYIKGINNIFNTLENSLDPVSKWEIFKVITCDFSINFAKHSKNNVKNKIRTLEKEIDKIENSPSEQIKMNLKKKLESKLNEMYNEIAKGAQIRSKSKWIEEGGKY